jgi:Domain of unknown function (DUF4483)
MIVVHHWNVDTVSQVALPELDYVTMNRNCLKKGIIDHKGIQKYRVDNPVRVKVGEHALFGKGVGTLQVERRRGPLPSDSNKNFTYGMPTRYHVSKSGHQLP